MYILYFFVILKYGFLILFCLYFFCFIFHLSLLWNRLSFVKLYPFAISSAIFIVIYIFKLKNKLRFLNIFFHELTHAFFAIIMLNRLENFNVSRGSGSIEYTGKTNWIISLSPYFFPMITTVFIIISYIIKVNFRIYVLHIIGISFTFFILTLSDGSLLKQTDIQKSGRIFSILIISILNLMHTFFILYFLQQDTEYFMSILYNSLISMPKLLNLL